MPEVLLWSRLRQPNRSGHKIRRQFPVGRFFVDFAYLPAKLAFEVDGLQHDGRISQDDLRTNILSREGWSVHRFSAQSVLRDPDGISELIFLMIDEWHQSKRAETQD